MDDTYDDDIDLNRLERDFNNLSNPVNHPTAPSATPSTSMTIISPREAGVKDINRINFLKYTDMKLNCKEDILIFYRDLYTQSAEYNVHITKIEDIKDVTNATVPSAINDVTVINITSNLLYQKFRRERTIDKGYETAWNLLDTTTNGSDFLMLLLRQAHTMLMAIPYASSDIPRYSSYKDIYKYAKAIKEYERRHNLAKRTFSTSKLSNMFLDHLDDPCFKTIASNIVTILRTSDPIPPEYHVPALATYIDQLVTPPPSSPQPSPPLRPPPSQRPFRRQNTQRNQNSNFSPTSSPTPHLRHSSPPAYPSTIRKPSLSTADISHEYSSDEDKTPPTNYPSTYITPTVTKSSTSTINRVNDSTTPPPLFLFALFSNAV